MANRLPRGYWKDWNNVNTMLDELIEKLGHFPTQAEMVRYGSKSLPTAIARYHGGVFNIRRKKGYDAEKPDGYWKKWEHVSEALDELTDKLGTFPTQIEMRKHGFATLPDAILKYHGGMKKVRLQKGYPPRREENGYWSLENTLKECQRAIKEHGYLPSRNELLQLNQSSLGRAIDIHGGFTKIRGMLGESPLRIKNGSWEDVNYCAQEALRLMQEHGFEQLPSPNVLRELKAHSLTVAISNLHGGFPTFREKLNKSSGIPSEKEQLEELLTTYVDDHGKTD